MGVGVHNNIQALPAAPLSFWALLEVVYGSLLFYLDNYFHVAFRIAGIFEIFVTFGSFGQGVQWLFKGKQHRCAHTDGEAALQNWAKLHTREKSFWFSCLVAMLPFGEDFHQEICPSCDVSIYSSFWLILKDGWNKPGDVLPVSLPEIMRIREIADDSMHLLTDILKNYPDVREVHKPLW